VDPGLNIGKCAEIFPGCRPLADNDEMIGSTPDSRRCRFRTIAGSKVPSRSRGTSTSTGPISV